MRANDYIVVQQAGAEAKAPARERKRCQGTSSPPASPVPIDSGRFERHVLTPVQMGSTLPSAWLSRVRGGTAARVGRCNTQAAAVPLRSRGRHAEW